MGRLSKPYLTVMCGGRTASGQPCMVPGKGALGCRHHPTARSRPLDYRFLGSADYRRTIPAPEPYSEDEVIESESGSIINISDNDSELSDSEDDSENDSIIISDSDDSEDNDDNEDDIGATVLGKRSRCQDERRFKFARV